MIIAMIIFLSEDRAYKYWVTHHRLGYVLDGRRKPRLSRLTLHRADCPEVRATASKKALATTGHRLKACSLDRVELETWAGEQAGAAPTSCPVCRPSEERSEEDRSEGAAHLSRLGREVLEYIVEAAIIHMEHEFPPYRLAIGDIAMCFAKKPGQLAPVLQNLLDQGMIELQNHSARAVTMSPKRIVFPTAAALRTLDSFREESDVNLEAELSKLRVE